VSPSTAAEAFAAHAPEYTALRRRLVPGFDAFYGALVDAVALAPAVGAGGPVRVLDLGAGTGLVSAHVLDAFPDAQVEVLDAAEPMLAEARATLGDRVGAVHVCDLRDELPAGPFDAVVSALAIHHLQDADKRSLLQRVRAVLAPGGVFVNAEQVTAADPRLAEAYLARWVADCRALGASEPEIQGAIDRGAYDLAAPVESQLHWLRDAGFAEVDCLYKSWRFAVYAGYTAACA
jgi:tRNA (cmo5U34)-methyltransferase